MISDRKVIRSENEANTRQVGGQHYKTSIEVWDFVIANDIGYLEGNAIKYLARWRKKDGIKDLEKARHYLEKIIEIAYREMEEIARQAERTLKNAATGRENMEFFKKTEGCGFMDEEFVPRGDDP
jgi:hypothetical protein